MLSLNDFTKERLSEIATSVIWELIHEDKEYTLDYFKYACDMSIEELEYFGVKLTESEKEKYAR